MHCVGFPGGHCLHCLPADGVAPRCQQVRVGRLSLCSQALLVPSLSQASASTLSHSQGSEVWRVFTTSEVGHVTRGQGCPDHQTLHISGAQHFQAFCLLGKRNGGTVVREGRVSGDPRAPLRSSHERYPTEIPDHPSCVAPESGPGGVVWVRTQVHAGHVVTTGRARLRTVAHNAGARLSTLALHCLARLRMLAHSWDCAPEMGTYQSIGAGGVCVEEHKTPWSFPG